MHKLKYRTRWLSAATGVLLGFGTVALGALHSARSFAAEDDYTRAIREEGARLNTLNRPATDEAPPAGEAKSPATVPSEFEKQLRAEAPASHRFYSELDAGPRQKVYALYLKEGKVSEEVKRLIVKLRLGN
jgi:hypothetical protein